MAEDPDVPDDEMPMVRQEADDALLWHGVGPLALAEEIDRQLEGDEPKPHNPALWRAVARELRRRSVAASDVHSPEMIEARLGAQRSLIIALLERDPALIAEIQTKIGAQSTVRQAEWYRLQALVMEGMLARAMNPDGPPGGPVDGHWPDDPA